MKTCSAVRRIQSNLGLAWDELNRPDSAVPYHRRAIETAAESDVLPDELALTINNLGVSYRRAGWPDSALVWYDRADSMGMPDPGLLHLNRGLALGDLGRVDEALSRGTRGRSAGTTTTEPGPGRCRSRAGASVGVDSFMISPRSSEGVVRCVLGPAVTP